MIKETSIEIRRAGKTRLTNSSGQKLEFGSQVADHMFVCDYHHGQWQNPQIVPYGALALHPATLALHYGQSVFEGMKAFGQANGKVSIFRIEKHHQRFVRSLDRMCMPAPSLELFREALIELVSLDKSWIPAEPGASLYIRPFIFASEARFGIKISDEYRFIIFTGPVPALFTQPIKVKVETEYIRAARGGTGFTKCAGNYGGAFYPTQLAREQGYDQVIWTSGGDKPCVEESGMMNLLFIINDVLITAPKSDTILDGVTRDSLLTIARDRGWKVEERPILLQELEKACRTGQLREAFGAGTAAVIAPIGTIRIGDIDFELPNINSQSRMFELKTELQSIRMGLQPDRYNWNTIVD